MTHRYYSRMKCSGNWISVKSNWNDMKWICVCLSVYLSALSARLFLCLSMSLLLRPHFDTSVWRSWWWNTLESHTNSYSHTAQTKPLLLYWLIVVLVITYYLNSLLYPFVQIYRFARMRIEIVEKTYKARARTNECWNSFCHLRHVTRNALYACMCLKPGDKHFRLQITRTQSFISYQSMMMMTMIIFFAWTMEKVIISNEKQSQTQKHQLRRHHKRRLEETTLEWIQMENVIIVITNFIMWAVGISVFIWQNDHRRHVQSNQSQTVVTSTYRRWHEHLSPLFKCTIDCACVCVNLVVMNQPNINCSLNFWNEYLCLKKLPGLLACVCVCEYIIQAIKVTILLSVSLVILLRVVAF